MTSRNYQIVRESFLSHELICSGLDRPGAIRSFLEEIAVVASPEEIRIVSSTGENEKGEWNVERELETEALLGAL